MIIKHPEAGQEPKLWALWKRTFAEEPAFLELYEETAYDSRHCLCVVEGEKLLAAVHWLDHSCEGRPFAYIYALAVEESCRGRGIGKSLLAQTEHCLQQAGYAGVILVPGEHGLWDYYGKLGYVGFCGKQTILCKNPGEALPLKEIGWQEFCRRWKAFSPERDVLPVGNMAAILQKLFHFYAGEDVLFAAQKRGDQLLVPAFFGNTERFGCILGALSCREGKFSFPGEKPFAMYRKLNGTAPTPAYFSFAMDE